MEGHHDKQEAKVVIGEKLFSKPGQLGQTDILSDIFPPKPHLEYTEWHGFGGQSSTSPTRAAADKSCKKEASKSPKASNEKSKEIIEVGEVSKPCNYCSTAVDYGAQDDYVPYNAPNPDFVYPDPKHTRGEWWQGSLYY